MKKISNSKRGLPSTTFCRKSGAGFTLLEVLVAVGVVGVASVLIAQVFFATTRSNTKTELLKNVKQNGDFAVGVVNRLIRNATAITTACSTTGTTTTTISLTNPDGNTTTLGCLLDGAVTRIASVSATATDYLTDSALTLGGSACNGSSLSFVCTTPSGQPTTVTVSFTLSQKGTPVAQFEKSSASFQTTVAIRNTAN